MAHIAEKVRLTSERGHRVTSLGRLQEGGIRAGFPHRDADSPSAVSAHDRLVPLAIKSELDLVAVVRVRRVPQTHQADPQDHLILPLCLRCREATMLLTCIQEEYPGYKKRMFECPVCGSTMTQWASDPLALD